LTTAIDNISKVIYILNSLLTLSSFIAFSNFAIE